VKRRQSKNTLILLAVNAAIVIVLLVLVFHFSEELNALIFRFKVDTVAKSETIIGTIQLVLFGILAYIVVRGLSFLIFGMFRLRRGFDGRRSAFPAAKKLRLVGRYGVHGTSTMT